MVCLMIVEMCALFDNCLIVEMCGLFDNCGDLCFV